MQIAIRILYAMPYPSNLLVTLCVSTFLWAVLA